MLKIQNVQAEAGRIVYGRLHVDSVEIPLILAAGKHDGPVVVVHCAQHRTEYGGSTAVPRFLRGLDLDALKGTVVALPLVDVPAITTTRLKEAYPEQTAEMREYSGQESSNINRVWPGDAAGSWVNRLAHAISDNIFRKATAVMDIHAARTCDHPFAGYSVEHAASKELALAFGTRVVDQTSFTTLPLGQVHKAIPEKYDVPSIIVEMPCSSMVVGEPIVAMVDLGIRNVCRHYGMLPGKPELPAEQIIFNRPDPTHVFISQHVGFFAWYKGYGSLVKKGEVVGEVRSLSTFEVLQECVAPFDGGLPSVGPTLSQVVLPGEELATLKPVIEIRRNVSVK